MVSLNCSFINGRRRYKFQTNKENEITQIISDKITNCIPGDDTC